MRKIKYISLFSWWWVGCFWFKDEWFECIATNELLEKRLEIQKYNKKCKNKNWYISWDIRDEIVQNKILDVTKWNKIDIVIATPPCQWMSVANHKKNNEWSRNSLVVESLKIIDKINPKYFVLENVRSFLSTSCTDKDWNNKKIEEAIKDNLSWLYNIWFKVINFKNIWVPTSRTRTLVIWVRKDIKNITPYDLFPKEVSKEITLKESIWHYKELNKMWEIDENDFLHFFREYRPNMRNWLKNIWEWESAFDNINDKNKPHKIVDWKIVINQNKNWDKYKRQSWDKVWPCIHTRNDILASQNTVHPKDDRVFSIRELMTLMWIPENFQWFNMPLKELNKLPFDEKKKLLKKEELNIRHIIWESVPTLVFRKIAKKIKKHESYNNYSKQDIQKIIETNKLYEFKNIILYIKNNKKLWFTNLSKIIELSNTFKEDTSAFYTRKDIIFSIIKDLPDFKNKDCINILEPSVWSWNFLPLLIDKYKHIKKVNIDVIDIDKEALKKLKLLLETTINMPKNININFININYLDYIPNKKYDLVVWNPPFKKLKKWDLNYKYYNIKSTNIFVYFLLKSLENWNYVSLIIPKSFISSPEYNDVRINLSKNKIDKIIDFWEKWFEWVKIETVNLEIKSEKSTKNDNILIESYINNSYRLENKDYMLNTNFPYWLLYRNSFFDIISDKLHFWLFDVFRDRQITKKHCSENWKIRVIKSRNLSRDWKIIETENDIYIDDISNFQVNKFFNKENTIVVPNLSYYPRAGIIPKNVIIDWSLAILIPKKEINLENIKYFSSEEFTSFYKIARNFWTRSLNIDTNSVYFFWLPN